MSRKEVDIEAYFWDRPCPPTFVKDPRIDRNIYGHAVDIGVRRVPWKDYPCFEIAAFRFKEQENAIRGGIYTIKPSAYTPLMMLRSGKGNEEVLQAIDYVVQGSGLALIKTPDHNAIVLPVSLRERGCVRYSFGSYVAYIAGGEGLGVVSVVAPNPYILRRFRLDDSRVPEELWEEYYRLCHVADAGRAIEEAKILPEPYWAMKDLVSDFDGSVTRVCSGLIAIDRVLDSKKSRYLYLRNLEIKYDSREAQREIAELLVRLKLGLGVSATIGTAVDIDRLSLFNTTVPVPVFGIESGYIGLYIDEGFKDDIDLESLSTVQQLKKKCGTAVYQRLFQFYISSLPPLKIK